jgi:hypothetical protein
MSSDQVDPPPQDIGLIDVLPAARSEDVMKSVKAHALLQRSNTESWIAWLLVIAIISALPLMLLITLIGGWASADLSDKLQSIFDRWLTLVGPLAGAAVGVGAMSRSGGATDER